MCARRTADTTSQPASRRCKGSELIDRTTYVHTCPRLTCLPNLLRMWDETARRGGHVTSMCVCVCVCV